MRRRRTRPSNFSPASIARTCRTYFDWHPIVGGFAVMAASAVVVTVLSLLLRASVPAIDGWAMFTPLNGAVLALLLMSRRKLWPFIMLGYVLALWRGTMLAGAGHHAGSIEIFGNVAELLIAAFTLPPYRNLGQWLQEPRLLRAFAGYALVLGPAVMALAVTSSAGAGLADLHVAYWERVRIVGFSESLGMALGTSLVLVLCNRRTYELLDWRALPRTIGLFALLGLATWFGCKQPANAVTFLPIAVLIVVAFQIGVRGVVIGVGVVCAILCAIATLPSHGIGGPSPQGYLAIAILSTLPLGVTLFRQSEMERRITDYRAELDKLKSLDRITGVANRRRFDLVLAREWQRATRDPKPIALLMIDTDFFELYIVQYGTQAGDECLRLIAGKMASQPHRQYDLLSRFEGGRFSVLLPGASGDAVKRIGEEFRAEIAALEWPHERSQFGRVTVSVGWASMVPDVELKPEQLIAAADAALESAKRKGKNRVEGFSSNVVEMTSVR